MLVVGYAMGFVLVNGRLAVEPFAALPVLFALVALRYAKLLFKIILGVSAQASVFYITSTFSIEVNSTGSQLVLTK